MYSQSITRAHRTAFVLAIDCSGSMAEEMLFGSRKLPKAEVVAEIANDLLFELVERARRSEGVRNYYDLAVLGYGGDDDVFSLLSGEEEWTSVEQLSQRELPIRNRTVECRQPDGQIALREIPAPAWVSPRAAGQTPMCEALRRVRDLTAAWCADPAHAESFPPVVFNITDGEATDCDAEELGAVARQLREIRTADGAVLLINIHLAAGTEAVPLLFPTEEETSYPNRYARLLYDCSSPMPALFEAAIREIKGPMALPPFRGMCFNASACELITLLNIGSISVKTE